MGEDQEQKHICKFCSKVFPCGRSLGGHMRSHLITVSSDHAKKSGDKLPRKRIQSMGRVNSKEQPNRALKRREGDALLGGNPCKECGKSFHSLKALFGHMKCHSVNGKAAGSSVGEGSNSDHGSDDEAGAPRRKRSDRVKRYASAAATNSSSLSVANVWPIMSEIEEQEQEEVALSLIILSMDKGDWCGDELQVGDELKEGVMCNESEVNSKSVIKERLESKPRKRKCIDMAMDCKKQSSLDNSDHENKSKFTCSICRKGFPSYQALGGHRASHKKFKGCCAPRSENSLETENSPNQSASTKPIAQNWKKSKEHECPICLKVFPSGQALGGHKRSHLVADQAKSSPSEPAQRHGIPRFIDLNLPAPPDEEDCSDFKPWWIATGHQHEPILGLLSS